MERLTGKSWHPSDRIIDNHVAQLRKKIEQHDGAEWIKTVRGAGYMFTSKTTRDSCTRIVANFRATLTALIPVPNPVTRHFHDGGNPIGSPNHHAGRAMDPRIRGE